MTTPFLIDPNQVDGAGGQMGTQGDQFGAGGAPVLPGGQLPTQQAAAAAIAAEQADRRKLAAGVGMTGDQTKQAAGAYGVTEATSAQKLDLGAVKDFMGMITSVGKDGATAFTGALGPLATAGAGAAGALANSAASVGGQMAQTSAKMHPEGPSPTPTTTPDPNAKTDAAAPAAAPGGQDNKQSDDKQKGQ